MSAGTPARVVPAGQAISLVYGVVLRQLVSRGRIIALTLLALISTVAGAALGTAEQAGLDDAVGLIAGLGLGVVLPVVALVFGGAAIGDLREDKTLVYLWLRPMDRWPIVVGAAGAAFTLSAPVTLLPVSVGAGLTGFGGDLVVATVLAGLVGLVGYTALFTLFGIWLRRFIVWGLAYILIWEGFVSNAGAGIARFTILRYTRSILSERTGADVDLAGATQLTGIVVPLVAAVVFVALGAWRLGREDID
jgi:ABC-2 type transport system permease protein